MHTTDLLEPSEGESAAGDEDLVSEELAVEVHETTWHTKMQNRDVEKLAKDVEHTSRRSKTDPKSG